MFKNCCKRFKLGTEIKPETIIMATDDMGYLRKRGAKEQVRKQNTM